MSLDALIPSAIDGLMLGFVYGLAAMGLTLIFGVMRVINLSHGPVIALGMYVVYVLFSGAGVNPYLGVLVAAAVGLAFGVAIYFIAVDRVINAPELTTLLATYSVNLMIIGAGTAVLTTTPRTVDVSLRSEEHTSELQSRQYLVCRLLLEKKRKKIITYTTQDNTSKQPDLPEQPHI